MDFFAMRDQILANTNFALQLTKKRYQYSTGSRIITRLTDGDLFVAMVVDNTTRAVVFVEGRPATHPFAAMESLLKATVGMVGDLHGKGRMSTTELEEERREAECKCIDDSD